jgi:atrial natriuretic peptide receptor A
MMSCTDRRYLHLHFNLVARKDHNPCLNSYAGSLATEEFYLRQVSVFIAPTCSFALDPVARMASFWNVPILTGGGIGVEFSRKNYYTSLTTMVFSLGMSRMYLSLHFKAIFDAFILRIVLKVKSFEIYFKVY